MPLVERCANRNEAMFADVPEAVHLGASELNRLINEAFDADAAHKQDPCEELCAASAAAKIVAIEAAWVSAMIFCGASGPGYLLCIGLATTAKYASLAAVGIDLAQCLQECEEEDPPPPPAKPHAAPWKQSN